MIKLTNKEMFEIMTRIEKKIDLHMRDHISNRVKFSKTQLSITAGIITTICTTLTVVIQKMGGA